MASTSVFEEILGPERVLADKKLTKLFATDQSFCSGKAPRCVLKPRNANQVQRIVQGAQGTMGVVTWASMKLELLPRAEKLFFVPANRLEDLLDFTYDILRPKLPDECLILNKPSLAALCGTGKQQIQKRIGNLPPWTLIFALAGYEHFPEERVDYLEKDIADLATSRRLSPVEILADIDAESMLELLRGPSDEPYWKLRPKGTCHDLFFLTTLDKTPGFMATMAAEAEKQGQASDHKFYVPPLDQMEASKS